MEAVLLASLLIDLAGRLGEIFYFIVLPVLLLAALGYVLQRKLGLDMTTLTRLNFYFVVPAVVYVSLVGRRIELGQASRAVVFGLATLAGLMALSRVVAWLRRVPHHQRNALTMVTSFYNSGNYGLPLQELAFRGVGLSAEALTLQVILMVVQNITGFTLGVVLAASGHRDRPLGHTLLQVLKFPPLYALPAALITVAIRSNLDPEAAPAVARAFAPFWEALNYASAALVAVALVTLGAQLATVRAGHDHYPVRTGVLLRLLGGPALGLMLIYALRALGMAITPFEAQVFLISTCTPTAVNCMLLCMQFKNHPDFAAQAVFYSTLLSPISVTLTILAAQGNVLPGF